MTSLAMLLSSFTALLIVAAFAVAVAVLPIPLVLWAAEGAKKASSMINSIFPIWVHSKVRHHEADALRAPGQDFSKSILHQEDFHDSELPNANFEGSHLNKVNFTHTNLWHANFRKCDLSEVDFTGAELVEADFRDADMTGAILDRANLRGAKYNLFTQLPFPLERARFKGMILVQIT